MIIYNLFPLLAGPVSEWKPHLIRAAEMGFDWIFVNPIQKPGMSGSLYSIKDYFQINPLLVDNNSVLTPEQQVQDMIKTADSLGLKMMIDLVINHCAVDCDLTREHPEWFIREGNGSFAHPFCMDNGKKVVWGDLIRFNHDHTSNKEGLYQFFVKTVDYLLKLGFRGFRCDAAYQVPRWIWERLIRETKNRYPNEGIVFTAETLGCSADQTMQTAKAGFDYIFNSSKWWDFEGAWLFEQYQLTREVAPSISFPESHDTTRVAADTNGNLEAMKKRYLFSTLFSAGAMMPIGFEFGFRKKLHVVETRPTDWEETNIDLRDFILKVNRIKTKYRIFQEECPTTMLPYPNRNIVLIWKASNRTSEEALLILNKDIWNKQHFHVDNLSAYVQAGAPLMDISPEYALDYIPTRPFSYDLRPGQSFVFVTERN